MSEFIKYSPFSTKEKLSQRVENSQSRLCVGLDVYPSRDPQHRSLDVNRNFKTIDSTQEFAACYKFQLAGYLGYGHMGLDSLKSSISYIKTLYRDIPVILDAKVNDIGISLQEYAEFAYDYLQADAITANPYLGRDANQELLRPDKLIYFLCTTTNPGSGELQDYWGFKGPLYSHIASRISDWNKDGNCGLVVSPLHPWKIPAIRDEAPHLPFLIPGLGAQGANTNSFLGYSITSEPSSAIVNVSRGITQAENPREAALDYKIQLSNFERLPFSIENKIVDILQDADCIKFGDFTLASGEKSAYYIDLRKLSSQPELFKEIIWEASKKLSKIDFDFLATAPTAGMPITTALSFALNKPMIWVRKESKGYGTHQEIEGGYDINGKKGVIVDDVFTTGGTKYLVLEKLRVRNSIINDVFVIVDRRLPDTFVPDGLNIHSLIQKKHLDGLL